MLKQILASNLCAEWLQDAEETGLLFTYCKDK